MPEIDSVSVAMLSNFGPEVRGVSHYADHLATAMEAQPDLALTRLDFAAAFPAFLLPAVQADRLAQESPVPRVLHWARPASWQAVADTPVQLLHMQYWSPFSAYYMSSVVKRARSLGRKVVLTVHNPAPHESLALFSHWEKMLLLRADALIVHTASGKAGLLARLASLEAERVHVIPHGVPLLPQTDGSTLDVRQVLSINPDQRLLVTFGNLRGYKGIPVLLKAWQSVSSEFSDVTLVIAGRLWSGSKGLSALVGRLLGGHKVEEQVKDLLAAPGIQGRVLFREGFVEEDMIDALCQQADLGVFPHERMAGQSGAVTRAAGAGLPVLVSRVGGLPDMALDERFLVPPGDDKALASALALLLAQNLSPLRAAQRDLAATVSWPKVAGQHADLYRMLVP